MNYAVIRWLGAHIRCVVVRCCQASDRTGVFEKFFSYKCQVTSLDVKSTGCVGQKSNLTKTFSLATLVWTLSSNPGKRRVWVLPQNRKGWDRTKYKVGGS